MMTSPNGKIFRVTGPLCGEFTGHRWIPRTKASEAEFWCFFSICAWINGWVNNHEASDLRRHGAHYDVIVIGIAALYARFYKFEQQLNSWRPSDAYMRQWIIPPLLQIMACRLFGTNSLLDSMLPYSQLDTKEYISVKFYLQFKSFHSRKCT